MWDGEMFHYFPQITDKFINLKVIARMLPQLEFVTDKVQSLANGFTIVEEKYVL